MADDPAETAMPPVPLSPTAPPAPQRRAALTLIGLALAFTAFYLPWFGWTEPLGDQGLRYVNISGGELAHAAWKQGHASAETFADTPTRRFHWGQDARWLWAPLVLAVLGLGGYFLSAARGRWDLARHWVLGLAVLAAVAGWHIWGWIASGTAELDGQLVHWGLGELPADGEAARVDPRPGCGLWIGAAGWALAAVGCRWLEPRWRPPTFSFARHAPALSLVALLVASTFLSEAFPKTQNLLNIVRQVSFTGIIALGMTLVIIGGGIDLSVGSMTALAGSAVLVALNWGVARGLDGAPLIALAAGAGLLAGAVLGAGNGLLVTAGRIAPFIATLGTMSIFRSLVWRWGNAGEFRSESELFGQVGMGGWLPLGGWPPELAPGEKAAYFLTPSVGNNLFVPLPVWALLGAAAVFALLLGRTRFGRHLCAVGSNERVALYAGVRVGLVRLYTYVLAGVTVGLSGFLYSARLNSLSTTNAGTYSELDAIAAVIMGGTPLSGGRGTVWGTVIGALLLGVINNMLNMMGVSTYWQGTVKGLAILAAVLLQRRRE